MKKIAPADLVCFDDLTKDYPLRVDAVYAKANHPENIFKQAIYRPDAKIWGHKDIVEITLQAANLAWQGRKWILVVKDCLRPVDAQDAMIKTEISKQNPQWFEDPRLLSPPGKGGHPRGMAIDVVPVLEDGTPINMGTVFDHLAEDKSNNPAARAYTNLPAEILDNRKFLETCFLQAAEKAGRVLVPLPQEWWDFRFPNEETENFAPLSDKDLPPEMRMTTSP